MSKNNLAIIDGDTIAFIAAVDKVEKDSYTGDKVVLVKESDAEVTKEVMLRISCFS